MISLQTVGKSRRQRKVSHQALFIAVGFSQRAQKAYHHFGFSHSIYQKLHLKAHTQGAKPLTGAKPKDFEDFLEVYADIIVQKWIDYFVLHKNVELEKITNLHQ